VENVFVWRLRHWWTGELAEFDFAATSNQLDYARLKQVIPNMDMQMFNCIHLWWSFNSVTPSLSLRKSERGFTIFG
jgi:activator of HSP90 ATPase